jgi:hypothetical protein
LLPRTEACIEGAGRFGHAERGIAQPGSAGVLGALGVTEIRLWHQ